MAIEPVRGDEDAFTPTMNDTVVVEVPVVSWNTLIQSAKVVGVKEQFDVMLKEPVPPKAGNEADELDSAYVQAGPAG